MKDTDGRIRPAVFFHSPCPVSECAERDIFHNVKMRILLYNNFVCIVVLQVFP